MDYQMVYKTILISTIVDPIRMSVHDIVYKTIIVSTIVDLL